jgi:hypothetical protein
MTAGEGGDIGRNRYQIVLISLLHQRMKILAIIALGLAILSAFMVRGSFGHTITILAIGVFIGVPLTLYMGIWLLVGFKRSNGVPQGLKKMFLGSMITGLSLATSLGLGKFLHESDIRGTREYVAAIVPMLDDYRTEHGRYPDSLDVLPDSQPPRLLREPHSYRAEGDHYRFEYWDAAGMMEGYFFDSSTREWIYFD